MNIILLNPSCRENKGKKGAMDKFLGGGRTKKQSEEGRGRKKKKSRDHSKKAMLAPSTAASKVEKLTLIVIEEVGRQ